MELKNESIYGDVEIGVVEERDMKRFAMRVHETYILDEWYKTDLSNMLTPKLTHPFLFRLVNSLESYDTLIDIGEYMNTQDISFRDTRLQTSPLHRTKCLIIQIIHSKLVHQFKLECQKGFMPLYTYFDIDYDFIINNFDSDISDLDTFKEEFEDWWSSVMNERIEKMKEEVPGVMEYRVPTYHNYLFGLVSRAGRDRVDDVFEDYFEELEKLDYSSINAWVDVLKVTYEWMNDNEEECFEVLQYSLRQLFIEELNEFLRVEWNGTSTTTGVDEEVGTEEGDEVDVKEEGIEEEKEMEEDESGEVTEVADKNHVALAQERVDEWMEEYENGEVEAGKLHSRAGSYKGGLTRTLNMWDDKLSEEAKSDIREAYDVYEDFRERLKENEVKENPQEGDEDMNEEKQVDDEKDEIPDSMFYCDKCDKRHYQESVVGYNHREHGESITTSYYKMEGDDWVWAIPAMSEFAAKETALHALDKEPDDIEEVGINDEILQLSIKKISSGTKGDIADCAGVSESDFFVFNPSIDYPGVDNPLIYMGGAVSVTTEKEEIELDEDEYMMSHVDGQTLWIIPYEKIGSEESPDMEEMVPEDAIEDYEMFNNEEYDSVSEVELTLPSSDSRWDDLGEVVSEVYTSDKENLGESQRYIHTHEEDDRPRLFKMDDVFVIAGGSMKITDWIYK